MVCLKIRLRSALVNPRSGVEADPGLELPGGADPFSRQSIHHLVARYGSPLLIIDAQRVRLQYQRLAAALPGVVLHYALKPLPHAALVGILSAQGAYFDLASNGEVELVRGLKIAPQRCIHTHPIKRDSDIRTALDFGVDTFVVDNPDELRKFEKFRRAKLLIRVCFRSPVAQCDLSRKFGCDPAQVSSMLSLAAELRLEVIGLSFHVGSQTAEPQMYVEAIDYCRSVLNERIHGHQLSTLDIGGGFPVDYAQPALPIEEFCAPIVKALGRIRPNVRIIAEPGRYLSAPAVVAVAQVIGRALRDGKWWYYLDDGIYSSYSGQLYDHVTYAVEALVPPGEQFPSVLAGPTCDSIDVINEHLLLPILRVGDLILGRSMGAYTWACASNFNFFPRATILALDHGRLIEN